MKAIPTALPEVILFEPVLLRDARGLFVETFKESAYRDLGLDVVFVQDNLSISRRGVLRGLHYQKRQGKLITVVQGEIQDVAVDIRPDSGDFREMGRGAALGRGPPANLRAPRVRSWVLGALGGRSRLVQGDGRLPARRGRGDSLRRPGPRHRLEGRRPHRVRARPGPPAAQGRQSERSHHKGRAPKGVTLRPLRQSFRSARPPPCAGAPPGALRTGTSDRSRLESDASPEIPPASRSWLANRREPRAPAAASW